MNLEIILGVVMFTAIVLALVAIILFARARLVLHTRQFFGQNRSSRLLIRDPDSLDHYLGLRPLPSLLVCIIVRKVIQQTLQQWH